MTMMVIMVMMEKMTLRVTDWFLDWLCQALASGAPAISRLIRAMLTTTRM